jgi:Zn-dependent protease
MKKQEILHIIAAILILTAIISFQFMLKNEWQKIIDSFIFSIIFILMTILAKKLTARSLDADVEHSLWQVSRYGFKSSHYLKPEIPAGIVFPIFFSIFSLGLFKVPTLLTYETNILKRRAAKRFGYYSYTEMTDWHTALIGAAGIVAALIFAIVLYFSPCNLESFAIISTLYAFFNMIPISKLDGSQIFYGSRLLWTTLALITFIFVLYAFLITAAII